MFHLLKLVELSVAQAWWAVCLVAIDAEVAVLVSSNDSLASETLASGTFSVLNNHLTVFGSKEILDENRHLIPFNGS